MQSRGSWNIERKCRIRYCYYVGPLVAHILPQQETIVGQYNLYILNTVRCPCVRTYVRNAGRGQLNSEWRHNENDVIMRTGTASTASAVDARRHNEHYVTMTIAGLWRYGDWRHVATGCIALVYNGTGWLGHCMVAHINWMPYCESKIYFYR